MGFSEISKRAVEHARIHWSRLKYKDAAKWPYERFAQPNQAIKLCILPAVAPLENVGRYSVYNLQFDLTKPIDWFFTVGSDLAWPGSHYSTIDYRPDNRCGDVRINWELNRLQFLPGLALRDELLAKRILADWLAKNRFMHGPSYIASMEVALRWISIYRAACLFKQPMDTAMVNQLAGLAMASGRFIEDRLSTHSSAGNHLIVEAVGMFWVARALEEYPIGGRWMQIGREILNEQVPRQINPDGSGKEQSFWYLGFVLDAVLQYYLLENREAIPDAVWERVGRALSFIRTLMLPDGSYPDFGDRDDGFVSRPTGNYDETPFPRLLQSGANYYKEVGPGRESPPGPEEGVTHDPQMKTYPDGGMTILKWGRGRLLFRHSHLGLEPLFGHGHADALSILFWWNNVPVLIDPGSGQYNGDQGVRNFFRSTIAHNTVEVNAENQATILGPFMWADSYRTTLHKAQSTPWCQLSASHDGYAASLSTIHKRDIDWPAGQQLEITDRFSGPGGMVFRGAFHLGPCHTVNPEAGTVTAAFGDFNFLIEFPDSLRIDLFHGSEEPFMGWHSTVYGEWRPNYSIVYSGTLIADHSHTISLKIESK